MDDWLAGLIAGAVKRGAVVVLYFLVCRHLCGILRLRTISPVEHVSCLRYEVMDADDMFAFHLGMSIRLRISALGWLFV